MFIYLVHNGVSYNLEVQTTTSVEKVKEMLYKLCSINPADQILLCETKKMSNVKFLRDYGLPSNEKKVYLFDRRFFEPNSPEPSETVLKVEQKIIPTPPLPKEEEYKWSPLVWELMKSENTLLENYHTLQSLQQTMKARLDICKTCLFEQSNQIGGLYAAMTSLNEFLSQTEESFVFFRDYFLKKHKEHKQLLESFPSDLKKLQQITLHEALANPTMKTLLDFFKEQKLKDWANECSEEHEKLERLIQGLESEFFLIKDQVIKLGQKQNPDVNLQFLENQIKRGEEYISGINDKVKMFSEDYQRVKDRVSQANKSQSNWSFTNDIDSIKANQENKIKLIKDQDNELKNTTQYFAASKTKLSQHVHRNLKAIAELQSKLTGVRNKMILYDEAFKKQKEAFQQLHYVQRLPNSYKASIEEVSRRRKFGKSIQSLLIKTTQRLEKIRNDEIDKRKSFINTHGSSIPRDLIPGLTESLPPFEIQIPPFDKKLPLIDLGGAEEDMNIVLSDELKIRQLQEELRMVNLSQSPTFKGHSEIQQSQESIDDYKKRIHSLEATLNTTYSQIEEKEKNLQSLKDELEKEKEEKFHLKEELLNSTRLLSESKIKSSSLEDEQTTEKNKLKEAIIKIKELEDKIKKKENHIRELTDQCEMLKSQVKELEKYNSEQQNNLQILEEKMELLSEIEETVSNLRKELEQTQISLQQKNEELSKKEQEFERKIEQSENQIQLLQTQIDQLNQSYSVSEKKRIDLENSRISEVNNQQTKSELEQQVRDLRAEKRQIQNKYQNLYDKFLQAATTIDNLTKERKELTQSSISETENRVRALEKEIQEKEKLIEKQKIDIQEKDDFIKVFRMQLEENKSNERATKFQEKTIEKLNEELSQKQNQIENLKNMVEDLMNEKEDMSKLYQIELNEARQTECPRLAKSDFRNGDLALFLEKDGVYEADNVNCPHYFLDWEIVTSVWADQQKTRSPIFGQIVEIREEIAGSRSRYRLSEGTKYHAVVITSYEKN